MLQNRSTKVRHVVDAGDRIQQHEVNLFLQLLSLTIYKRHLLRIRRNTDLWPFTESRMVSTKNWRQMWHANWECIRLLAPGSHPLRAYTLHTCMETKGQKRSTEECSKLKSPETRQVQERLVSTL